MTDEGDCENETNFASAIGALGISVAGWQLGRAQNLSCDEVAAISNMAESKSNQSLRSWVYVETTNIRQIAT